MKYKTIYADPPWEEYGGGKIKRGADNHYPLMKTADIIAMADFVKSLADDNPKFRHGNKNLLKCLRVILLGDMSLLRKTGRIECHLFFLILRK